MFSQNCGIGSGVYTYGHPSTGGGDACSFNNRRAR